MARRLREDPWAALSSYRPRDVSCKKALTVETTLKGSFAQKAKMKGCPPDEKATKGALPTPPPKETFVFNSMKGGKGTRSPSFSFPQSVFVPKMHLMHSPPAAPSCSSWAASSRGKGRAAAAEGSGARPPPPRRRRSEPGASGALRAAGEAPGAGESQLCSEGGPEGCGPATMFSESL